MWRKKYARLLSLGVAHIVLIFLLFTLANAQSLHMAPEKAPLHPKLESVIATLEKEFQEDPLSAKASAQSKGIKIGSQNTITVYLIFEPGTDIDEASLQSCGAKVIKGAKNVVKIRAPINMLKTIADTVEGVSFIKFPDRPIPTAIQSQGVALTGASSYHTDGYTGTGVKVAVIDTGFAGLSSAIANNELPNDVVKVDCTGSSCVSTDFSSETERHGTACAEIVHDMAPGLAFIY